MGAAAQTYSQSGNDAQIYELWKKVHETMQGEMTTAKYVSELTGFWQELDYYQDFQASSVRVMQQNFRNQSRRSVYMIL